jgi:DNA-binding NarL/FixJ family response regulator
VEKSQAQNKRAIQTLIVDDSAVFREALGLFLTRLPNVEVVGSAASGEEALDRVAQLSPQLVLMDLEMPGMDGLQATTRIRQGHPATRVIIVTVHDSHGLQMVCRLEGAHGVVSKSRLNKELPEVIRNLFPNGDDDEIIDRGTAAADKPSGPEANPTGRSASNHSRPGEDT